MASMGHMMMRIGHATDLFYRSLKADPAAIGKPERNLDFVTGRKRPLRVHQHKVESPRSHLQGAICRNGYLVLLDHGPDSVFHLGKV